MVRTMRQNRSRTLRVFPDKQRRALWWIPGAILVWPVNAEASDMAILVFFLSFPACVVLVGISFLMAALIKPSAGGLLAIPIGLLVVIHLVLLPHMYHPGEAWALAIQAAMSSTALLSIRVLRRRTAEKTENAGAA
jgi:hypothetical protein